MPGGRAASEEVPGLGQDCVYIHEGRQEVGMIASVLQRKMACPSHTYL